MSISRGLGVGGWGFGACAPLRLARERGSALLAVLWLSAALAAIAFSLANTVRGEAERASTSVEGAKAYYLAVSSIDRAYVRMMWGQERGPDNPYYVKDSTPVMRLEYPTGLVMVEVIPENSKLNINTALREDLFKLLMALGVEPERARDIALAIEDWRRPAGPGAMSPYDQYYASIFPSFRPHHASIEEIEELLTIRGMTPELFYGTYDRVQGNDGKQRLVRRAGFRDCVSVFGSTTSFDINSVQPAVMVAIGIPADVANAIVERRRQAPIRQPDLAAVAAAGANASRLKLGGNSIFTLRATAQPRTVSGQLSDLRRTVSAMVKFMPDGYDSKIHILRWYDN